MDGRGSFWVQLHGIADTIRRQGGPGPFVTSCIDRDYKKMTPEARREADHALEVVFAAMLMTRSVLHVGAGVQPDGAEPINASGGLPRAG
jgi:hypothetical protein